VAALAWLAAGLCSTTSTTVAPTAAVAVAVDLTEQRLEGSARYDLSAGKHVFDWHPALEILSVRLNDAELPDGARTPEGLRLELRAAAGLAFDWRLPLAPLDGALDHRAALRADRPMTGGGFAWLPAAAGWYPGPTSGLGDYSLTVRTTAGLPIAAGAYSGPAAAGGTNAPAAEKGTSHTFRHPHPAGGIDLLIGPYALTTRAITTPSGVQLDVATYFTPAIAALASDYLDAAAGQIIEYDALIGPWPFARFAIVASPLPTGFGMPGMTWLGEEVLRLPFIPATSLRHEVLHNWWGNGVRVDYARGNWSEGLTTLMADFLVKEREGPEAAAAQRLDWVRTLLAVPPGESIALRDFRARAHGRQAAVGYGKAAFVLLMLRERIGAEAWRAGLRHFWQACQHREASWADLQQAFEQASGQTLDSAFEPWLSAQTLPTPRITRAVAAADGLGLTLHLSQGEPVHDLDLPVQIRTEAGTEMQRVRLSTQQAVVQLRLPAAALGVRLDPSLSVLRAPAAAAMPPILRNALLAAMPAWWVSQAGDAIHDTAEWQAATATLAAAFFERPAVALAAMTPGLATPAAAARHDALLLTGPAAALSAEVAALGLGPQRPAALSGPGEAHVWTARTPETGITVVIVEADNPATLAALARPLPHHGASGWLLFNGGRATARGAAPLAEPEIPVTQSSSPPARASSPSKLSLGRG